MGLLVEDVDLFLWRILLLGTQELVLVLDLIAHVLGSLTLSHALPKHIGLVSQLLAVSKWPLLSLQFNHKFAMHAR